MNEHIIDVYEDYGQFVELDIESQELIYNKPIPNPNSFLTNELKPPSLIRSIYVIFMCIIKKIHEL